MPFIVTEGDKVLGYTSPGGKYTKNTDGLSLEDCQKKQQNEYAAYNNPESKQTQSRQSIQEQNKGGTSNPLSQQESPTGGMSNDDVAADSTLSNGPRPN